MEKISVYDAIGKVLCHDITQIIPGQVKGRAFKKGHVIKKEDISVLLSLGKEHIFVWEDDDRFYHENEAAEILSKYTAGKGLDFSEVKEGKINFVATCDGFIKVDVEALFKLNSIGEMALVTRHNNVFVRKGERVAGTRVIPLMIEKEKMSQVEAIAEPIIWIEEAKALKVGVVTTGSEVYKGRIKDAFGPVIKRKFEAFGSEIIEQKIVDDKIEMITEAIQSFLKQKVDVIVCTGGMSVDPDDVTPTSIKQTGAEIIQYGSPVLPGSMFLVAYHKSTPILGLPGCVMYSKQSVFDLMLPKILTGEKITRDDINKLGHGGLCLNCETCVFPNCCFGKA